MYKCRHLSILHICMKKLSQFVKLYNQINVMCINKYFISSLQKKKVSNFLDTFIKIVILLLKKIYNLNVVQIKAFTPPSCFQ